MTLLDRQLEDEANVEDDDACAPRADTSKVQEKSVEDCDYDIKSLHSNEWTATQYLENIIQIDEINLFFSFNE